MLNLYSITTGVLVPHNQLAKIIHITEYMIHVNVYHMNYQISSIIVDRFMGLILVYLCQLLSVHIPIIFKH